MRTGGSSWKWSLWLFAFLCLVDTSVVFSQVRARRSVRWERSKLPAEWFVPPGDVPTGLAWDGQHFWVADAADQIVSQLTESGEFVADLVPEDVGTVGAMAWDGAPGGGLWMVDQEDWSIRLVRADGGPAGFQLRLPRTGLARAVPVTGLTCDTECRSMWLCISAGHCSKFWRFENPRITLARDPNRQHVWVEASFFPSVDPRGLAWVPAGPSGAGCLWSIAYNGTEAPSRETAWAACGDRNELIFDAVVGSQKILDLIPWRRPSALTLKGGQLWAAFEADADAGQEALVLPLRTVPGPCACE